MKTCTQLFALVACLLAATWLGHAATRTWDGGDTTGNWNRATNWVGDVAPVAGDDLVFPPGAARLTNTNNFASGTAFKSVTLSGSDYVIGGNSITLGIGLTNNGPSGITNKFTSFIPASNAIVRCEANTTLNLPALGTGTNINFLSLGTTIVTAGISGTGDIQKTGAGLLVFSAGNSYSGATTISDGTLRVLNATSLGTTAGGTTVSSGATLEVLNNITITEAVSLGGTLRSSSNTNTLSGVITLTGFPSELAVDSGSTLTISNAISGLTHLIKSGTGQLIFSGTATNTYSGLTTVTAGKLVISKASALGSASFITVVDANATLEVDGNITSDEPITITGTLENHAGTNILTGAIGVAVTNATVLVNTNTSLTLSNEISGAGGLVKNGEGALKLGGTNANTYSSATIVNEGTLVLNKAAGTTAIPAALIIGDGVCGLYCDSVQLLASNQISDSSTVTVNYSADLTLNGNDETIGPLNMDGALVNAGAGTLTLNGDVTKLASTNFGADAILGKVSLGGTNRVFTINTNATPDAYLSISEVISDGGGSAGLIKQGPSELSLSGLNTYTGPTIIAEGSLKVTSSGALGAAGGGTVVSNGATLQLCCDVTVTESALTLFGTLESITESNAFTGTITLGASNATILVDVDELNLSGALVGSGGLMKTGSGALLFTGTDANTYAGSTFVNQGAVLMNKTNALSIPGDLVIGDGSGGANADVVRQMPGSTTQIYSNAAVTINSSGLLNLGGIFQTIGSLAGSSGASLVITNILIAGGNNASTTFAGIISGPGVFRKAGAGTMTLSGNNTLSGDTTVLAGTLLVNGTQTNSLARLGGGTLGGTGSVGGIQPSAGGTLSPGVSPGILNSSQAVIFATNVIFTVELNGTNVGTDYDQLNVLGSVSLNGSHLSVHVGFTPAISNKFTIINNDGGDVVNGTFANLPNGAIAGLGGTPFQISYAGGDGNDVVLTRVRPVSSITNAVQSGTNVQFQVAGVAGVDYIIEASTNLVNWQVVSTNTAGTNGVALFVDSSANQFPERFFRALTP